MLLTLDMAFIKKMHKIEINDGFNGAGSAMMDIAGSM